MSCAFIRPTILIRGPASVARRAARDLAMPLLAVVTAASVLGGGVMPASAASQGVVIIGDGDDALDPEMDVHAATGNLLEVQREEKATHGEWVVHISTDGGSTWDDTYTWQSPAGHFVVDVDCSVVAGYLYVVYVSGDEPGRATVRRFSALDGTVDAGYGSTTPLDSAHAVEEVVLVSNADGGNNSFLRLAAITSDGAVHLFTTDRDGGVGTTPWQGTATLVNDAWCGLDATYAEGHAGVFLYLAYVDFSNRVWVSRWAGGDRVHVGNLHNQGCVPVRISAYGETVLVAFEDNHDQWSGSHAEYRISEDEGDTWSGGILGEADTDVDLRAVDVTLRKGRGGLAVWGRDGWLDDHLYSRALHPGSPGPWTSADITSSDQLEGLLSVRVEPLPDGGWAILRAAASVGTWVEIERAPLLFLDGLERGDMSPWSGSGP